MNLIKDPFSRRTFVSGAAKSFLGVSAMSVLGGKAFGVPGQEASKVKQVAIAHNVIYFYMTGGMSHLDTFDPKPENKDVMGLTKTASLDGRRHDIAVGQIDVGNAGTDMAMKMAKGVPQANGDIAVEPLMDVNIVGQSVLYMASLPLEANVMFHTVMVTKMPFAGRG